ncbi:MAG: PIN domain-containing protein [Bifidobacteriaceae bacterium]|jgi:predicted nucleic-acid-binding protein|nr:PIN domain-containing protein [Bifidobacteriaceae bacterium]
MPSLDANCLLRWLLGDIPDQAKRVEALLGSGHRFEVGDEVVLETVFVLERQALLGRETVKAAIETVMAEAAVDMDRDLWRQSLDVYAARPKLSMADICFALKAVRRRRTPLYTFDKKMISQLPGCAAPPAV